MTSILKPFIALYAAILLVGTSFGLLTTFLSLRLTIEGFSTQLTGMILTAYFIGSVVGTSYCSKLIKRIGHIRAFTVLAALGTAMVMLHACYLSALAWAVFRFFSGISIIGLFMVIESWLNECTQPQTRGRVFSIYMLMCYLGVGIGQQLLNFCDVKDQTLFFIIGFLMVSCIIPVALTHSIHPQLPKVKPIRLKNIFKKAPLGMLGSFTGGFMTGAFYTMGPVFCHQINLSVSQLSYFIATALLGGLLLQWPMGAISDRFDRSLVIPVLGGVLAVVSGLMIVAAQSSFGILMAATAVFGGLIFSLYPTAVARAHDMFEPEDVVNVSSALLLFYGLGAIFGPIASSAAIELFDSPYGLYICFSITSAVYAVVSFILRQKEIAQIIPVGEQKCQDSIFYGCK